MGRVTTIDENETILEAAQRVGIGITAYCGSQGTCGKCRVKIVEGIFDAHGIKSSLDSVNQMEESEKKFFNEAELAQNYRLSCITRVKSDVIVEIPKESRTSEEVILENGKEDVEVKLKPAIKTYYIELDKATLKDNTDDISRIKQALADTFHELNYELEFDYHVLLDLSQIIRESNWKINVSILYDKKVIKVESGDRVSQYGVAIDIGTTTIAAYLCDLKNGVTVDSASMMNPQISFGDDVLSRISHCTNADNGVEELRKILLGGLNELIASLAKKANIDQNQIMESVIVFNTVMEHIALGINPKYLGVSPFISTILDPIDINARDFGIDILPSGNVHILPAEAGFIGADNVAVLISEEPHLQDKIKLIIDIGTNSEICLGNKDKLYSTSCATGPALEGAQIQCGMRAAKGAIEAVKINPITLEPELKIIGQEENIIPVGICGSGILDVVAQMYITGIIESNGKFAKKLDSKRVRIVGKNNKEYVLYFSKNSNERDIVVSQKDVRAVQLAKSALYAGAKTLMKFYGTDTIDEIILAGAFGSYIDKENALKLGLYPDCHLDNVKVVGNAAGLGARLALFNIDKRIEANEVSKKVEFVEIATNIEYQNLFAKAMAIPHQVDSFTINQSYKWGCGGLDNRTLSEEVLNIKSDIFQNEEAMETVVNYNQIADKTEHLVFPIIQGIEAMAYGAEPKLVGGNYTFSDYKYQILEDIKKDQSISDNPIIKNSLKCITNQADKNIVLEVSSPFSILASLIDPTKLYRYRRKNKDLLLEVLNSIEDSLAKYTIDCIKAGVDIISYADSAGVMEMVGEKFYKEVSGITTYNYLNKISSNLENCIVHICGKTSYSLQKAGFIVTKVYRVESDKKHMEILLDYAKDPKFKFIGHSCIHNKKLLAPIINKLELTNCL
jgi:uncharacterized 2Fe-2S/4Fe-4S cluster protein (DUF4445 family)